MHACIHVELFYYISLCLATKELLCYCTDCPTGFIRCPGDANMTCVENTRSCDGVIDCPNGIDESPDICGQSTDHYVHIRN